MVDQEKDHDRIRFDQSFFGRNNQICELTTSVNALAEQMNTNKTNPERNTLINREENALNAVTSTSYSDSDTIVDTNRDGSFI